MQLKKNNEEGNLVINTVYIIFSIIFTFEVLLLIYKYIAIRHNKKKEKKDASTH
jgi:hypothetical protein